MLIKPGMCVKYNSKRWYTAQYGVVVSKKKMGKFWVVNYEYIWRKIMKEPYMDIEIINLKDVISTDQIECINHIGIYNVANIQYLLHHMSMFWIEFDPSVTEQDIIDFQRNHVNEYNMFCSCGRFVQRIIATGRSDKIMRSYEYMAANVEAANIDLKAWTT